jgi:hypothetical protein
MGFENIQETNSALYSLQIGLSNEVSLDIPLRLKKNSWGWLRTSGSRYVIVINVISPGTHRLQYELDV